MSGLLHFEDFPVGRIFELGPYPVTREEVIAFAREFDPQPFHLDEDAANSSVLGGLSASGWHNCAMLMRMMCDGFLNRSAGMGSNGLSEVKWLKPVYVGETLRGAMTVLGARISSKRPEMGILECRWDLRNEAGELKVEETGVLFMRVRAP
ncbi:MaoC family dehydratase [Aestuariivirga sp.]|uniref:MaoC family dehydratase n=1 Tax=Aestuariivirga sp. TaxID=2650926 RepID=UPI0039E6509B